MDNGLFPLLPAMLEFPFPDDCLIFLEFTTHETTLGSIYFMLKILKQIVYSPIIMICNYPQILEKWHKTRVSKLGMTNKSYRSQYQQQGEWRFWIER